MKDKALGLLNDFLKITKTEKKLSETPRRSILEMLEDEKALYILSDSAKEIWESDVVELSADLVDNTMLENMWKNIEVYSWDILDNFFLDTCVMNLKLSKDIGYYIHFKLDLSLNGIFLYTKDYHDNHVCGGVITIENGKFIIHSAYVSDMYHEIFLLNHINEQLPTDRGDIARTSLMNTLLYLIIANEFVKNNSEVITETSKRVELPTKKKSNKKKKNQSKKTKVIRYIKIDEVKVRRIREDYERQQREQYERHTSEWTKRGHYRTYKNGNKVWIKPTTCHAQGKIGERTQKIYKIK